MYYLVIRDREKGLFGRGYLVVVLDCGVWGHLVAVTAIKNEIEEMRWNRKGGGVETNFPARDKGHLGFVQLTPCWPIAPARQRRRGYRRGSEEEEYKGQ